MRSDCWSDVSSIGASTVAKTIGAMGYPSFRIKYPMIPKRMATQTSKARKRMLYVPISEQIMMIGPKTGNGMIAMRAHMPTNGRFNTRHMAFPIYMLAMTAHTNWGFYLMSI